MPSRSLIRWRSERCVALDEIEAAHQSIGGIGRGRRYATQQINQAYAVLLASQFQGFCRDLHSESADYLARAVTLASLGNAWLSTMKQGRRLDRGNAEPGNLGADFGRFGLAFWVEVRGLSIRNQSRQDRLEDLNDWRNAIARQDFNPTKLGATTLQLQVVRQWRTACDGLARSFDEVMRRHVQFIIGRSPW